LVTESVVNRSEKQFFQNSGNSVKIIRIQVAKLRKSAGLQMRMIIKRLIPGLQGPFFGQ
jgi:hypothetical protein